ncbi:MAG: OmpA family protein [Bacteroidales bacterium]|nr:OmpA family protein [Bacteroidales bacterium]
MKFLRYSFVAIFLCITTVSFAQRGQRALDRANRAFELQQFNQAATLYQRAFTRVRGDELRNQIRFQIAESYRLSGQKNRTAIGHYRGLIRARYYEIEPRVFLSFAEILRFRGEHEEAIEMLERFLELVPGDERATLLLESARNTEYWINNPTRHIVEPVRRLNSRANDFSPRFLDDNERALVFTSSREGATGRRNDDWTGQRFTDLFVSNQNQQGVWSTPRLLEDEGNINTIANEADAFFINNGNTVFFTYCANVRRAQNGCRIYTSNFDGVSWSVPRHVDLSPDSAADFVHPWVSADGRVIIFASNKEGSFGYLDLWMATRSSPNEEFGPPQNLGPNINTSGREAWPFLKDSLLYFASTGHPGLGGYDMFVSERTEDGWGVPENLGVPMNSSADDFGIVFARCGTRGFFSSNRNEGRAATRSDDDIWSFVLPSINFTISGVVRDDETMQLLANAMVQIIGSDGLSVRVLTNNRGFFRFDETQIRQDVTYQLSVSMSGYFDNEIIVTTVGLNNGVDFVRDFSLMPLPRGDVMLPEILYAVGRWELREQFQDSLMGLIELMEQNPRLVVELGSHTDNRPIAMTNDTLSQRRAQSVVDFLITRGIHPGRLVARGYGDRAPRAFLEDFSKTDGGVTLDIAAGTVLTSYFINALPTRPLQEIAHSLNRRTEFRILRDDFIPPAEGGEPISLDNLVRMARVEDHMRIPFRINPPTGLPEFETVINGASFTFVYDENARQNLIGMEDAIRLLRTGRINRNDFRDGARSFDEDGDILPNSVIILREMRIGRQTLNNVSVTVTPELPAPVILTSETMRLLGEFEINRVERELQLR